MLARELGIEVIQPEQLHEPEILERIAAAEPEVLTTCAYGVLIKEPLLSDYEMINVHPSLLPRWRGAAPIERSIMAGDAETGVAIMRVTAGLGLRPGVRARPHPDRARRRLRHARRAAGARSAPTCWSRCSTSARLRSSRTRPHVTYAHKIGARERALDPTQTPQEVERTIRALRPHIGSRLPLPDGSFLGVARRPRGRSRPARPPAGSSAPRATGCCSTATAARSS